MLLENYIVAAATLLLSERLSFALYRMLRTSGSGSLAYNRDKYLCVVIVADRPGPGPSMV